MPKRYTYIPLKQASLIFRAQDKHVQPPGMRRLRNFYVSRSNLLPTLRPDLEPLEVRSCTVAGLPDDFLNSSTFARNSQTNVYFTRYDAHVPNGIGCSSLACTYSLSFSVDTDGIANASEDILTRIWPGARFIYDGVPYVITAITGDRTFTVDPVPASPFSTTEDILLGHDPEKALWPIFTDDFFSQLIYNANRPLCGNEPARISGPFFSTVNEICENAPGSTASSTNWSCGANVNFDSINGVSMIGTLYLATGTGFVHGDVLNGGAGIEPQTIFPLEELNDTYANGTTWITVGDNGYVARSPDSGATWTTQAPPVADDLLDIIYYIPPLPDVPVWIAVGRSGAIIYSTDDGLTWNVVVPPTVEDFLVVAVGPSEAVAAGTNGTIYRSVDGITWVSVTGTAGSIYRDVTEVASGATWQLVGENAAGDGIEATFPVGGGAVSESVLAVGVPLTGVAYNTFRNVIAAVGAIVVFTYDESVGTWVQSDTWRWRWRQGTGISPDVPIDRPSGSLDEVFKVFPAADQRGFLTDGSTRDGFYFATRRSFSTDEPGEFSSFMVRRGNLVIRTGGGYNLEFDNRPLTDPNTFTEIGSGFNRSGITDVAFNGTEYVLVTSSGHAAVVGSVLSSGNHSLYNLIADHPLETVIWDQTNSLWLAASRVGQIYSSADGIAWTLEDSGAGWSNNRLISGWHIPGLSIFVGDGGTIVSSPDGTTWTQEVSGTTEFLLDVINDFGQWVAVGLNGTITTSPDGSTWNPQTVGSLNITNIVSSGALMVALAGPDVLTSGDGLIWNTTTPPEQIGGPIAYGNGVFVSRSHVSTDGTTWIKSDQLGVSLGTRSAFFDGSNFVFGFCRNPTPWDTPGAEFECFSAISDFFRSAAHAVVDGYTVLGGMLEYEIDENDAFTELLGVQTFQGPFATGGEPTVDPDVLDATLPFPVADARIVVTEPVLDENNEPTSEILTTRILVEGTDFDLEDDGVTITFAGALTPLPWGWEVFAENLRGPGKWVYHPRRIRWATPGTVNDFTSAGTGFADLSGFGEILAMRRVGHNIVIFESEQVSLLRQRGFIDDPWEYVVIKERHRIISNHLTVDDVVYWIASDGLIYQSDGMQVRQLNTMFDVTETEDLISDEPIWLDYSLAFKNLLIWQPNDEGTLLYLVEPQSGSVSTFELPIFDDGSQVLRPRSIGVVRDPCDGRIFVGYNATDGNPDQLVTLQFDIDGPVTGVDQFPEGVTDHWYGEIQTGEVSIVKEGNKLRIEHALFEMYSEDGDNPPDVIIETISQEQADWWSARDEYGVITVDPVGATGVGTAWARKIADGDGIETVFDTPGLVVQSRIYVDGTQQVNGVDYNQTGDNEITFVTAPAGGTEVFAYWCGEPYLRVNVGDYLETPEGCHRIEQIIDATNVVLSWLPAIDTHTATHAPARPIKQDNNADTFASKSDEIFIGLNSLNEDVRFRMRVVPRVDSTVRKTQAVGVTVVFVPAGQKLLVGDA